MPASGEKTTPVAAAREADVPSPAPCDARPATGGLSTDFLNRYDEALMLIELSAQEPSCIEDLRAWRPASYREHFAASPLRQAAVALAAYDALPADARAPFDELVATLDGLTLTTTAALADAATADDRAAIVAVAAPAFRRLIGKAASFINANGTTMPPLDLAEVQALIDELMAR
ncbi:hypothetical protein QNA08_06030 [Chelatococcus sp. SYSU_G07232]|uniref:Uncharacterized protein n=1 Tax=Chelatococcus albus TaxID=3047466 RepID=A0ABT7AEI8_9HYPH|nr:hypothetical protein [Chelatococcus sp. SYSU_G07232]MDJ1157788.1 hypothetical protein [Chelatococcus sp. SYSU_G07232]